MRMRRAAAAAVLLLAAGCSSTADRPAQRSVQPPEQTLAYATASPAQVVQLTRPAHPIDPGHSPWVMLLHGGGWIAGNAGQMRASRSLLVGHGYVVFSAGYRLLDAHTTFAEQWADVAHAWQWVREHAARFGADPDRGAVWGASAGGHLAALVGNRQQGARAVVSLAGVLEPTLVARLATAGKVASAGVPKDDRDLHRSARNLTWLYDVLAARVVRRPWRATDSAGVADWAAVDPGHYLSRTSPPTLIVQGTADDVVPPATAQAYGRQLAALRVPYRIVLEPGVTHVETNLVAGAGDPALAFLRERLDLSS